MKGTTKISAGIAAALGACVAGWLVFKPWQERTWRQKCRHNIIMIHEPMHCCVPMEKGLSFGAHLDMNDVLTYIRGGQLPKCPSGAEYQIDPTVGAAPPTCPYHGVLVTKTEWDQRDKERFEMMEKEEAQPTARGDGKPAPQP